MSVSKPIAPPDSRKDLDEENPTGPHLLHLSPEDNVLQAATDERAQEDPMQSPQSKHVHISGVSGIAEPEELEELDGAKLEEVQDVAITIDKPAAAVPASGSSSSHIEFSSVFDPKRFGFTHRQTKDWSTDYDREFVEPSRTVEIQNFMKSSRFGVVWEALQMLLSLLSIVLYIYSTYADPAEKAMNVQTLFRKVAPAPPGAPSVPKSGLGNWWEATEFACTMFFVVDIILNAIISPTLKIYFMRWFTWVDIISLLPLLSMLEVGTSLPSLDFLRVLRMFRVLRLLRVYRLMYIAPSGSLGREIALVMYVVLVLIMISSALLKYIEPTIETFHDAVYFVVVTVTTVGYGDLSPTTAYSKLVICMFIFAAIVIVPMRVNRLVDLISLQSRYSGVFKGSGAERHIIVTGLFDHSTLHTFLTEFFHPNHGLTSTDVCILGKNNPGKRLRLVIESHLAVVRSMYLQGTPMATADLQRCKLATAAGVFILADKTTPTEHRQAADAEVILYALSVVQYNENVPVFCQVLLPRNVPVLYSIGATHVVCIDELRMQLMAASCYCPSVHTLVTNLVTNIDIPTDGTTATWLREYASGCANQIYELPVTQKGMTSSRLVGLAFDTAAGVVFNETADEFKNAVTLIGVRVNTCGVNNSSVLLNPGNAYKIEPGDRLIVIAKNRMGARLIYKIKPSSIGGRGAAARQAVATASRKPSHEEQDGTGLRGVLNLNGAENVPVSQTQIFSEVDTQAQDPQLAAYEFNYRVLLQIPDLPPNTLSFMVRDDCAELLKRHRQQQKASILQASSNSFVSFEHMLIQHLATEQPDLRGHVVVMGRGADFLPFILNLRSKRLQHRPPIVVVSSQVFSPDQLQYMSLFDDVYIVQGEPERMLHSLLLEHASAIVILPTVVRAPNTPQILMDEELPTDLKAVLITMQITSMEGVRNNNVRVICSLTEVADARFLSKVLLPADGNSRENRSAADFNPIDDFAHPAYVSGRVYSEELSEQLLCQLYFNPSLHVIIPQLICSPTFTCPYAEVSSKIFLIPLPECMYGKKFRDLFHHCLSEQMVAIGLRRNTRTRSNQEGAMRCEDIFLPETLPAPPKCPKHETYEKDRNGKPPNYLFTAPPPTAPLWETDEVYVLRRRQFFDRAYKDPEGSANFDLPAANPGDLFGGSITEMQMLT